MLTAQHARWKARRGFWCRHHDQGPEIESVHGHSRDRLPAKMVSTCSIPSDMLLIGPVGRMGIDCACRPLSGRVRVLAGSAYLRNRAARRCKYPCPPS